MTSEQQIKYLFGKGNVRVNMVAQRTDTGVIRCLHIIVVTVKDETYNIGIGTGRYSAFTDALYKVGGKRIYWNGNYQKNKIAKK